MSKEEFLKKVRYTLEVNCGSGLDIIVFTHKPYKLPVKYLCDFSGYEKLFGDDIKIIYEFKNLYDKQSITFLINNLKQHMDMFETELKDNSSITPPKRKKLSLPVVKIVADYLLVKNGSTTSLEVKNELRELGFEANQNEVKERLECCFEEYFPVEINDKMYVLDKNICTQGDKKFVEYRFVEQEDKIEIID